MDQVLQIDMNRQILIHANGNRANQRQVLDHEIVASRLGGVLKGRFSGGFRGHCHGFCPGTYSDCTGKTKQSPNAKRSRFNKLQRYYRKGNIPSVSGWNVKTGLASDCDTQRSSLRATAVFAATRKKHQHRFQRQPMQEHESQPDQDRVRDHAGDGPFVHVRRAAQP